MSQPWLSVIVPTFNGAAFLPAALDSILAQRDSSLEIVAIDDGSTDATPRILAAYARRMPMLVLNRKAGNWAANTTYALERARGEWVCFLHQDDLWRPGRLAALRPLLNVDSALVLHGADFIDRAGNTVGRWTCPLPHGQRGSLPAETIARLLVQNFVPLPTALFRRSDALRVGGLDEALWFTADWDLWLKLAALGRTQYSPGRLAAFRLHPESQTIARSNRSAQFRSQYEHVFREHWQHWRSRLADPDRVAAANRLSTEINVALAARRHGEPVSWGELAAAFAVGPGVWCYYLRNSRIVERVIGRLRARV